MADSNLSAPPQTISTMPSKASFWNDPQKRALVFQILLVIGIGLLLWFIFSNTLHNLDKRGIKTGFDFLDRPAGFGITQSLIAYTEASSFGRTFLVGLLNTLLVAGLGIIFATILGFTVGVARLSKNWLISHIALVFIETIRNIPPLLQILFWYRAILPLLPGPKDSISLAELFYLHKRGFTIPSPLFEPAFVWTFWAFIVALVLAFIMRRWAKARREKTGEQFPVFWTAVGILIGVPLVTFFLTGSPLNWDIPALSGFNFRGGLTVIPELTALLLALSIYTAAFIAEIVRSGIQSVSKGQSEAAASLGLRPNRTLQLVIIPQAMRVIIPQLTSQYLNLTKNTSLGVAIGYPDLVNVFAGTTLNQTGQAVEIIFMTMLVYLVISLTISMFMNWYNKRMALVER
ncbi:amino acid ABC transporter permease [uncultured Thiothrix sp.]|uniref:amino acid ABC transporter permease n=1 Tax=uncultured Thiothrix sp. TaxID=223185 RepID=UPI0026345C64|nr:amino acid ABC transporter permease [uncultured Thiothrix sp.]HMT94777.1 amino acid ABC transporter permease [Thiolinea sp.]